MLREKERIGFECRHELYSLLAAPYRIKMCCYTAVKYSYLEHFV